MKAQIPWLRIGIEGLVIVGSILLALGLDEWRDGVQEREEEQRILAALAGDFRETRANLQETIGQYVQVRDAVIELLEVLSSDVSIVPPDELSRLIGGSFLTWFLEPRLSTYEEIVGSGNLRLIRSDSLRLSMAQVGEDLHELEDFIHELFGQYSRIVQPYFI